MANPLSFDDFIDLLGRFGSDLGTWPLSETELVAVADLLVRSSAARDAVSEMRAIEVELRGDMPRAPAGLADRVLAAAGLVAAAEHPIRVQARARRPVVH